MVLNGEGIRLFLDTAEVNAWKDWLPTGMLYGVTTNPILLERAQIPCSVQNLQDLARQAFELGVNELHLQTWGSTVSDMVKTGVLLATDYPGRNQATIDNRIVIKVPATKMGTEAAARLIQKRIRVTLTGVYATHQVLIASALGTDYAAPYLGRIDDLAQASSQTQLGGRQTIVDMQKALSHLCCPTRLLVASLRQIADIAFLATQGLNTFTFAPKIAEEFFNVAATNQAATDFEQAARWFEKRN